MAREPTFAEAIAAFRLPAILVDHLTARFYEAKLATYRERLSELRAAYGGPARVYLSTEIRDALLAEARRDARSVTQTYEGFAAGEARRLRDRGLRGQPLFDALAAYMRDRGRNRAGLIARSELVAPRLDATVSFFRENGVEPDFDFAGPEPNCPICKVLIATNPHPIEEVLAIGVPHIQCQHTWRVRKVSREALLAGGLRPGQISAGRGEVAGIVGGQTLAEKLSGTAEQIAERLRAGVLRPAA